MFSIISLFGILSPTPTNPERGSYPIPTSYLKHRSNYRFISIHSPIFEQELILAPISYLGLNPNNLLILLFGISFIDLLINIFNWIQSHNRALAKIIETSWRVFE